jgi:hypothetical protein
VARFVYNGGLQDGDADRQFIILKSAAIDEQAGHTSVVLRYS